MKMRGKATKKVQESLEDFLTKIEELNEGIATVTENVNSLKAVNNKIINEPSSTERQKLVSVQEKLIHDNKVVGRRLQKMIKEEKQRLANTVPEHQTSEHNIKKTQLQTASQRFLDIWTQYNNHQLEFRSKNKKALLRNLKIISPGSQMTEEELEEKLDNGDVSVLSSIIRESNQAKEDLKRIENRHAEIVKLEKGITEIHEMFLDLSNLVEMQGEMVDRVEMNIMDAAGQVESGRQQLQEAERKQKSARRKKFILAAILAGVALIVILVLLITFL